MTTRRAVRVMAAAQSVVRPQLQERLQQQKQQPSRQRLQQPQVGLRRRNSHAMLPLLHKFLHEERYAVRRRKGALTQLE